MIAVQLLGALTIAQDGRLVTKELGPSGRALSGFLFEFTGRVHRRERLADLFWAHLDTDRARTALNTAVWRIRKMLANEEQGAGEKLLVTSGPLLTLERAHWLEIDTMLFEERAKRLLDQTEDLRECRSSEIIKELSTTVESYTGPFMDGEDSDWVLEERERLLSLYFRLSTRLTHCLGYHGRYEEGVAVARRLFNVDPYREAIYRDLLLLLVLNGQRAEALRQHRRWSDFIKDELDVDPMPETVRLVGEIRSGKIFDEAEKLKDKYFVCVGKAPATYE